MQLKLISLFLFAVLLFLNGCSSTSPTGTISLEMPSSMINLNKQPNWLLISGKDIKESEVGGDILTLRAPMKLTINATNSQQFSFQSYDPNNNPLKFGFKGEKIVYFEGKGEIINVSLGEKVILPFNK